MKARFLLPLLPFLLAAAPAEDVWQKLQSPEFSEREKAMRDLLAGGKAIRFRLGFEMTRGSIDKRERCARLLRWIDWGLEPSVPPDAIAALDGYDYAAPMQEKRSRVARFRAAAQAGSPAALWMGLDEPSLEIRQQVFNISEGRGTEALMDTLVTPSAPDLRQIIRVGRAYDMIDRARPLRTAQLTAIDLLGENDREIKRLKQQPGRDRFDNQRLGRLLAQAGRMNEARTLATQQRLPMESMLAIATADWPALLAFQETRPQSDFAIGGRIMAMRLSGDETGARERLTDWQTNNRRLTEQSTRRAIGRACLLNDQIKEGVELLSTLPEGVALLRLQGRWAEALQAANNATSAEQQLLRRETGLEPTPAAKPADPLNLPPELTNAADAWQRGDFTAALSFCQPKPGQSLEANGLGVLVPLCLEKLNQPEEAKTARRQVQLRLAANDRKWVIAIAQLDAVKLTDIASDEAERLRRVSAESPRVLDEVYRRDAALAEAKKDWPAAALAYDKMLATQASAGLSFTDPAAYLRLPYRAHVAHARAALAAGDSAKAVGHLKLAHACLPLHCLLVADFAPKLTAAGEAAVANELFDSVWTQGTALCQQFPNAAVLRNDLAWMALRCDRHLDDALKLATEATARMPDNAALLDTLAEARFRHGQKETAIATMRKSVAASGGREDLKKRLAAFERGEVLVVGEGE